MSLRDAPPLGAGRNAYLAGGVIRGAGKPPPIHSANRSPGPVLLRTASQDRGSVPGHAPSESRLISQQRLGSRLMGTVHPQREGPSEAPSPSLNRRPALDAEQLSYQRWSGLRPVAHLLATDANVSQYSTVVYNNDKDSTIAVLSNISLTDICLTN